MTTSLAFWGGIEAKRLAEPLDRVKEWLEPLVREAAKGGGFVYHSDHSVPLTVPYSSYKSMIFYVTLDFISSRLRLIE